MCAPTKKSRVKGKERERSTMTVFDCLDGIEDSINFGNNPQRRQVGHPSKGEVNSSTRQCRTIGSPSSDCQQQLISQRQDGCGSFVKTNHKTTNIAPLSPHSTVQSSSFFPFRIATTTTSSCCDSDNKYISSMSSPLSVKGTKDANFVTTWRRNENLLSCLLITANVGTIFEESTLLELWFQQLKDYLIRMRPGLVAIHCQEVGGKNYESSMKNVSNFTDKILGDDEIIGEYSRVRIFLDDNFECLEKFTALGSLYLIHDSVQNVKLYNFETAQYDSIQDRVICRDNHSQNGGSNDGETIPTTNSTTIVEQQQTCPMSKKNLNNNNNIDVKKAPTLRLTAKTKNQPDSCHHVDKVKFPKELFPECRWSRKGFMRTRWLFNDSQPIDLVNIHLFHDASNLIAMETTPSPYARNRQRALEFALKQISTPLRGQILPEVPLFIFGDFNFRLDTNKVIQKITEGVPPIVKRNLDSGEDVKFVYHRKSSNLSLEPDPSGPPASMNTTADKKTLANQSAINNDVREESVVMTIGKKLFDCENLDEMFRAKKNTEWLQELDIELNSFKDKLFEFKISFSPSYPFKEDESGGYSYMKTRCPAWCDRILFNPAGKDLIFSRSQDAKGCLDNERKIELLQNQGDVIYRLMGNCVPMGDHKPVLLYCQLELSTRLNPSESMKNEQQQQDTDINELECNQVEQQPPSSTNITTSNRDTSNKAAANHQMEV